MKLLAPYKLKLSCVQFSECLRHEASEGKRTFEGGRCQSEQTVCTETELPSCVSRVDIRVQNYQLIEVVKNGLRIIFKQNVCLFVCLSVRPSAKNWAERNEASSTSPGSKSTLVLFSLSLEKYFLKE